MDIIREMSINWGHNTRGGQRLWTYYWRWLKTVDITPEAETADSIQELVRDGGKLSGDFQRL